MLQSRRLYLSLLSVVAWFSTAAATILTILEAVSLASTPGILLRVAAASAPCQAVSLCCIAVFTYQHVWRTGCTNPSSIQARALTGLAIALSGIAMGVSIALIVLIKSRWDQVAQTSSTAPIADWNSHVNAQIAVCAVSLVSQAVLYSSLLWPRRAPIVHVPTGPEPRDSVMSDMRDPHPSRNLYVRATNYPTSPLAAGLPSPTFSSRSSHSLKSFRESLRHVVRPATSRTTLISRPSFNRDARSIYSQSESVDEVIHSDGFDSWDTSSVSLQARDAVSQTAPSKGTTLDTIPGSRPATPARALEGPFLTNLAEEDEELTPPPKMMPDVSRPPSPAVSEAHIHPLFRTESPIPPPEASVGTSIIASPLSNQAIACPPRPFNRMRSNSQLSSTQLARSVRGRAASPQASLRSLSPISRELTPPIPDFVLNSSPRSSLSGSRRVQLQY